MLKRTTLSYSMADNEVTFRLNPKVYHREAVYGTALVFTSRCYVFLSGAANRLAVTLQGKEPHDAEKLRALAGDFHNELLNQTLRWMVGQVNRKTKEAIITQALFAAHSPTAKSR